MSLGALGDSFYEYLLKMWVYHGGRNNPGVKVDAHGREAFDGAMRPVFNRLIKKSKSGFLFVAESKGGRVDMKMGHLACFAGGMFYLAAKVPPRPRAFVKLLSDLNVAIAYRICTVL